MKLLPKLLLAGGVACLTAHAQPVFIEGVSADAGWYDCNKKHNWGFVGFPYDYDSWPPDNSMCWAHAAANVLQWWQDRQDPALIPSSAPNGKSDTAEPYMAINNNTGFNQIFYDGLYVQQLAIFKDIARNWSNSASWVKQAYNWYFNGGRVEAFGGTLNNTNSGGYYADLGLVMNADGVTSPLFTSYTFNDNFTKDEIISTLTGYIDNDYGTTLRVIGSAGGHAITMWGYEISGDDFFVYLTDSDDRQHALIKQKVIFADDKYAYLTACDGDTDVYTESCIATFDGVQKTFSGIMLSEAQALQAPALNVPEPATATLSLLALTALLARKRRRSL